MVNEQPEALRLADWLDHMRANGFEYNSVPKAAAELRRLYALNQEMLESLHDVTFLLEASLQLRGEPHPGNIGAKARAAIAKATGEMK